MYLVTLHHCFYFFHHRPSQAPLTALKAGSPHESLNLQAAHERSMFFLPLERLEPKTSGEPRSHVERPAAQPEERTELSVSPINKNQWPSTSSTSFSSTSSTSSSTLQPVRSGRSTLWFSSGTSPSPWPPPWLLWAPRSSSPSTSSTRGEYGLHRRSTAPSKRWQNNN